jgi:hypothetical protein
MNTCGCSPTVANAYEIYFVFLCLVAVMADSIASERIDEVRASILAQVIRRDYLEQMVEKAKSLESEYGSDYPREISKTLQDIMRKETRT